MVDSESSGSSEEVGLCSSCRNVRRITSAKGSVFYMCELSALNPAYAKYPQLPVISCPGYAPEDSTADG